MFAPILNWVMGSPRVDSRAALKDSQGEEILLACPARREILWEIKDLLVGIPRERRPELVDQVAARFALYVVDLPASERNHGSEPYGLLDHSLDVARSAARELVRPSFRVSEDPVENYREQPIWGYAGVVLGLLHDAGKLFDLEVVLPGAQAPWNPLSEPLAAYLRRSGRTRSGTESWKWKSGRGVNGHVWKTEAVAPLVIPIIARQFLGSRLEAVLQVFALSYKVGKDDLAAGPARRVVEAVRRADRAHAECAPSPGRDVACDPAVAKPVPVSGGTTASAPIIEVTAPPRSAEPSSEKAPTDSERTHESTVRSDQEVPEEARQKGGRGPKQYALKPKVPERDRRIEAELQPGKLIESLRSWIRSGNVNRNSPRGEVFVRQDYLWLRYPDALTSLIEGKSINWSTPLGERLLAVLLKCREVDAENPKSALVYAFPDPRDKKPTAFVRLRAKDFLPEEELAGLGFWPYEMRVQPTAVPRQTELPFQSTQGRRF
jgi:hypothetical protein